MVTGAHSSGRTVTTGRRRASLIGRWRIEETDVWDRDALDLVGPAFIGFGRDNTGSFGFIAVRGWMDCRETVIDECPAGNTRGMATMNAIMPADEDARLACYRRTRCKWSQASDPYPKGTVTGPGTGR